MSEERKAPEIPPEYPPESTGMRWIPIAEVETLIGKRERNARYWLDRHNIPARGERPKLFAEDAILAALAALRQRHRKPPERAPEYPPESAGMSPETHPRLDEPIEAAYRVAGEVPPVALVPLQTMVEELRGLAGELSRLAERNEALALEVGGLRAEVTSHQAQLRAKDEALTAKDETIAAIRAERDELRRRAEAAEAAAALREQARAPVLAQDAANDDRGTPEASDAHSAPGAGLWGRVRRWWAGGGPEG